MSLFIPLCLSLLAYASLYPTLSVLETDQCPPYTEGYVKDEQVYVCTNHTLPRDTIINHEVVHLIQSNLGVDFILPDTVLTWLVHNTLTEAEVLPELVHYNEAQHNPELEARVLQKLHPRVIMTLLRISQDYATITTGQR